MFDVGKSSGLNKVEQVDVPHTGLDTLKRHSDGHVLQHQYRFAEGLFPR